MNLSQRRQAVVEGLVDYVHSTNIKNAFFAALEHRGFQKVGKDELGILYSCERNPELGLLRLQHSPAPGELEYGPWPRYVFVTEGDTVDRKTTCLKTPRSARSTRRGQ
jgi:hypothetical protein